MIKGEGKGEREGKEEKIHEKRETVPTRLEVSKSIADQIVLITPLMSLSTNLTAKANTLCQTCACPQGQLTGTCVGRTIHNTKKLHYKTFV